MRTIPVDSTDAREQRELEEEQERQESGRTEAAHVPVQPVAPEHDPRCVNGWLGEDEAGRPIACLVCRPHLMAAPCRTCSVREAECATQTADWGWPCCADCDHGATPPTPAGSRTR